MKNHIAAITVTQGDFQYIKEWVEVNHERGIDFFLICYNGPKEDYGKLPQYDYVRYLDFSFMQGNELYEDCNRLGKDFSELGFHKPQFQQVFMQRLHNLMLETLMCAYTMVKWCIPMDTDEFINIKIEGVTLHDLIGKLMSDDKPAMAIRMQNMSDSNQIYADFDIRITDRLTMKADGGTYRPADWYHRWMYKKSVINMKHPDILSRRRMMVSPHNITNQDLDDLLPFSAIEIQHYYTKTLEEWIMKFSPKNDNNYSARYSNNMLSTFFKYNEVTDEKLIAIKGLLEKHNVNYNPLHEDMQDAPCNIRYKALISEEKI